MEYRSGYSVAAQVLDTGEEAAVTNSFLTLLLIFPSLSKVFCFSLDLLIFQKAFQNRFELKNKRHEFLDV